MNPALIGDYEITGTLGAGRQGTVYAGRQPDVGKRVAVKVFAAQVPCDAIARFRADARAVNALDHRNIVDLYGFGCLSDHRCYAVMEHLEGRSLQAVFEAKEKLTVPRALTWTVQILEALHAAHEAGVLHRGLEPSALFVTRDGHIKILDFGLTRLPGARSREFMAPEQLCSQPVSRATDLYSLGAVLRALLDPADISTELEDVLSWMLQGAALARPQTAAEVLERVLPLRETYEAGVTIATKAQKPEMQVHVPARRPMPIELAQQLPTVHVPLRPEPVQLQDTAALIAIAMPPRRRSKLVLGSLLAAMMVSTTAITAWLLLSNPALMGWLR